MTKSRPFVAAGLAVALALVACSNDGDPPGKGVKLDGSVVGDTNADNAPVLADLPVTDQGSGQCVKECTDLGKFYCVKSGADCVECLTDAHCENNPGALGNQCDVKRSFCVCSADTDCANNVWGQKCDTQHKLCRCDTDAHCKSPAKCIGSFGVPPNISVTVCQVPCKTDADCTGSANKCVTSTGKCIECNVDADCTGSAKYCSSKQTCVACKTNAHCASMSWEKTCDPTFGCVECLKDGDCSADSLGNTCDTTLTLCVCAADADCSANNNGHKCNSSGNLCNCAGDADCPGARKCIYPYEGSTTLCQLPCQADAECTDKELPLCNATSGLCVGCKKAADCAASPDGSVCTANTCTCAANADCKGTYPWGNTCGSGSSTTMRCGCGAAADCTGNPHGNTCSASLGVCTCAADADCKTAPYTKCLANVGGSGSFMHCQQPPTP